MNAALDAAPPELSPVEKVSLWREMTRIRAFEQVARQYYAAGSMGGWLNVQIGQEMIPVVIRSLMGPLDHSISSYRCLGHALASGMTMRGCMAELFGKATGSSMGKGGMHSFQSPETRFWGGYGFAGTQTPLACGLGFALKHRGEAGAVFCCLGDGAVNQGAFHEALNLAALFRLPVVFIIENNEYAMGTSVRRSSAFRDSLASRAEGYGMAWGVADGNHLEELRGILHPARDRARHECLPTLLEVRTYRFEGHSIADANQFKYRAKAVVQDRQLNHDPIKILAARLLKDGIATEEQLKCIRAEALQEAMAAAEFAKSSPYPSREAITQDVYWEIDHQTANGMTGRHFFND
jgi:pyruvate dehydrogenase E1 component alpha subunit